MMSVFLDSQLSAVLRQDAFDELKRMTGFKKVFPIELIGCDNSNFKRAILVDASKSSAIYAVVDASCGRSVVASFRLGEPGPVLRICGKFPRRALHLFGAVWLSPKHCNSLLRRQAQSGVFVGRVACCGCSDVGRDCEMNIFFYFLWFIGAL